LEKIHSLKRRKKRERGKKAAMLRLRL